MSEADALSLSGGRWRMKEADEAAVERLRAALSLRRLTARALVVRGLTEAEEARRFIFYDFTHLLDPYLLQDMDRAVEAVEQAVRAKTRIRIYGDYDVDGVCATALMVRALRGLGASVDWYIPHRIDEGYGLNEEAIRKAAKEEVRLLITVDCGSSAKEQVALARELGIEVIVTDHHRPGPEVPEAPVLNPWRPTSGYPFRDLAGVGVAFKLICAVARRFGVPDGNELNFLDLVCLGTVADVVPLLGENRLFVQSGLRQLTRSKKLGVSALVRAAGLEGDIGSRHVAFVLAPRINAVGRMEHARDAVNLLLTTDAEEARTLAAELSELNDRRRQEEQQTRLEAEEMVAQGVDLEREKVIVLGREGWHPGVIGIVASRLVERYHRPALLVAMHDGVGKGSGRSIAGLNLFEALSECASLLDRFGGHHFAAGFGLQAERLSELRARMNEVADRQLTQADLVRHVEIDGEAELADLEQSAVSELNLLAPFGMGNPAPRLMTRGLRVCEASRVGSGQHLSLRFADRAGRTLAGVWFGQGEQYELLRNATAVDVCYRPQLDEWNGSVRVRMMVDDIRIADPKSPLSDGGT